MPYEGKPVCLHPENPRYFLYAGAPRVLVTATEHYGAVLNRNFDYVAYLDDAADKHATLSRCFLLFRELEGVPRNPHSPCKPIPGEYLAPFARTGPGYAFDGYLKFDLTRWDQEYMGRLHGFLSEAAKRGIVVELTLFSNAYGDPVWNLNPFNACNNVNGVGNVAWQDYNSMLEPGLFVLQQAYVRKIVHEVNAYDNLYFEICNEPFGDQPGHVSVAQVMAWHTAIRELIRAEEARLPKQHLIFQVPIERARGGSDLGELASQPVDAIDLHDYQMLFYKGQMLHPLSRFMEGDLKLRGIHYLWTACQDIGKPIVFDEDNAATCHLNEMGWTVQRKRAWTTVCSGGHYDMIDFSIQSGGQETGTPESRAKIRTWMKHLSEFIHGVDFVHTVPVRDFCSQMPDGTLVATLANAGREYVLYVADARETNEAGHGEPCEGTLAFELPAGKYRVRLYSPVQGCDIGEPFQVEGGEVALALPAFVHDVALHIVRQP